MDPKFVNSTNITSDLPDLAALQWPMQIFLICLYSATAGLSLAANIITIIVLIKGKRCAKDLRKFLINLSTADIGMALFSIPFTYTLYMFGRWIFYTWLCPVVNFVQLSSMIISIYTLAAIGLDRYFAIVHPLRSSVSWFKSRRTLIVWLIWISGISIGSTQLFISESNSYQYGDQIYYDCKEKWKQGSDEGKIYTILIFSLTFILPMIVLCLVYTLMGFSLFRHHLPGNETTIHQQFASRRIKVIKMLATIVILFIICWLPIQIFGILVWFYPNIQVVETQFGYYTFVGMYFFCHWISMAHSFMNPIIYSFMSENFRGDMKYLMRKVWHSFQCKIFDKSQASSLRIYTNSLNKSSIINGNKRETLVKNKDKSTCTTSSTLTNTYV